MKQGVRLITTSTEDICDTIQVELPTGVSICFGDRQFLMLNSDYSTFKDLLESHDKSIKVQIVFIDIPIEWII